jgi:hypothetical protein
MQPLKELMEPVLRIFTRYGAYTLDISFAAAGLYTQ